jgi:Peptidase family M50
MHTLRKYLCWVFAFTSLVSLQLALSSILRTIHRQSTFLPLRDLPVATVFTIVAAVFGVAWWTVWKGEPSARGWGIAASLTNILVSLLPAITVLYIQVMHAHFSSGSVWRDFEVVLPVLAVGVTGLVAFWRRYEEPAPTATIQKNLRIPGDGTNDLINKAAQFLIFAAGYGAYSWWLGWLRAKDVPANHYDWHRDVMVVLFILIITTLHELGHTATGLALGMKLRAFLIGPFQWHIREGKWEFQFKPKDILTVGGATAVVPATADFPRWSYLCMIAAGPCATLLTGIFALWIAFAAKGDSLLQAKGPLALFGAWSLVVCAFNLLPFRTHGNYSDGAQIYQLLSHGPWGDFHRVVAAVGSTLVTPLRPRNYDIQAILWAAHTITQGAQGLLLRVYAYAYFLDHGRILEAGEALREAESIYHQSASDIPAEIHMEFVFGSAYLRRDAAAAREWWTRMEAKKPTRFNADYWRADSALHWIEGDLKEANEAWEKSNALAQQLPKAGAYEFDRYCCSLLRKALDEASARTTVTV